MWTPLLLLLSAAAAQEDFASFKAAYNKTYASPEQEAERAALFDASLRAVAAHNARVWPERARQHGRVVVSDSGPKLAFACLQNGKWLNGAMSLPRDLESAIYGWAARLAVGGLPDTELTTRLGPNGEEF